jgi:hypothetical protein
MKRLQYSHTLSKLWVAVTVGSLKRKPAGNENSFFRVERIWRETGVRPDGIQNKWRFSVLSFFYNPKE